MRSTARVRIHRSVSILAIAGCLSLAGAAQAAGSTTYFGADKSGNLVSVAVTGNQAGTPAVLRHGNPETEQLSPADSDGGVIAGLVADIDAGTTSLFTYDTKTDQFNDLATLGHHVLATAVYGHGGHIVYAVKLKHTWAIRSVSAAGGTPTTRYTSKSWAPIHLDVSETGRRIFFSATKTVLLAADNNSQTQVATVFRLNAHGTKKLVRQVAEPLSYEQVRLSPDGSKLAIVRQRSSGSPRSRFTTINLATGNVRTVLKSYANPIAGLAWAADGSSLVFRDLTGWARVDLHGRIDAIAKTAKLAAPVLAQP